MIRILPVLAVLAAACSGATETPEPPAAPEILAMPVSVTDVDFTAIDGTPLSMSTFGGEVVLVVNTASKCGYTPQYEGLQALYETYRAQGFIILGAPSNDFGGQEPGTEEEIRTFCEINFGVDFPLTSKVHAVGPDQHAFWQTAKQALGDAAEPKWNFHKVLVGRQGGVLKAYPSATKPSDPELAADIESALAG